MKKLLIIGALVVALGVGGVAFARGPWGYGYGGYGPHHGYMMGPSYGGHMGWGYGPGPGFGGPGYCPGYWWGASPGANLSPEQTEKLQQLQQKEWAETKDLRTQLFTKQDELRGLYATPNADKDAIDKLEKDVFDLNQQLRNKHFSYRQEAEKIAPEVGGFSGGPRGKRGFDRGFGPGPGRGYGYNCPRWN